MADQLEELLREMRGVRKAAARDRLRRARVTARRPADAEIDASGIERLQHAEALGDAKGAVVGKQHAARADAQAPRLGAEARHQHLGARIGKRGDGVMLGEPVTVITQLIGAPRERERLIDRAPRVMSADDRRLVEDREAHANSGPGS